MLKKKNGLSFILLVIVIVFLTILPFISQSVKSWLECNKDLSGWFQALYSVGAIAFAVCVAYLPIARAENDKKESKVRSLVVFLAKYDRLISTEKGRAKDALQFFLEINNNIGSDRSKKKYFDFIDRIVYMQIEGVEDEGAAFDYNQKYFKDLVEAKANLNGIRRRIEGSNFGSKPLIDESYVHGVKERYDELMKEWFHKEGDSISLSQVGQNLKKELEQQFSLLKDINYAHGMRYGGLGKYIPTSVHQE